MSLTIRKLISWIFSRIKNLFVTIFKQVDISHNPCHPPGSSKNGQSCKRNLKFWEFLS